MKCTKIYNARAQPLFCSVNFLFGGVLVAVVVVVCLSSLMTGTGIVIPAYFGLSVVTDPEGKNIYKRSLHRRFK